MRYIDVCSGISAPTAAWKPLGWKALCFAEIEAAPRAVLAHHYPDVPLRGDFTDIQGDEYGPVDLLVGGTPCQSFSVAGLRGGLADERGNLALEYLRLADRARPRWLVWENVPGVLSSGGGRDFGTFLGGLAQLGYGFAYAVLDAQHFGVPQRRRRVFVVGYLGDWRRAAAVLFERHSLQGHSPPRREKGQGVAGCLSPGAHPGGFNGQDAYTGQLVPYTSTRFAEYQEGIGTLRREGGDCGAGSETLIAHSLRGEGFDASEDGTGRGTPIVPVGITIHGTDGTATAASYTDVAGSLRTKPPGSIENSITTAVMCFSGQMSEPQVDADLAQTMGRKNPLAVAFTTSEQANSYAWEREVYPTLNAQVPNDSSNIQQGVRLGSAVRRLTPRECERLQGFPDGFTLVPYRGGMMKDGPRYKMLGNSMAVPVIRWIGERIARVDQLESVREAA